MTSKSLIHFSNYAGFYRASISLDLLVGPLAQILINGIGQIGQPQMIDWAQTLFWLSSD